jgi:aminoglycoside phosphotransferase family enzyme
MSEDSVGLDAKLAFLRRPDGYPERPLRVEAIETHMSWVFLTESRAYKLKKPVRHAGLDFSSLALRRRHCEAEMRLNPRLAPLVYLGLVALTLDAAGAMHLDGPGRTIEWLVTMRRLPPHRMLDRAVRDRTATRVDIERVATLLAEFYRDAPSIETSPDDYRRHLADEIAESRSRLLETGAGLPRQLIERVLRRQSAYLEGEAAMIDKRIADRRIVEGHGDLRPEHVFLGPPPQVIDCLEFNRDLRLVDPADELAFLAMECERLGMSWIGDLLFTTYSEATGDWPPPPLIAFYKSLRAGVRARLAIMHLLDRDVRQPAHWRPQALDYLSWADRAGELAHGQ